MQQNNNVVVLLAQKQRFIIQSIQLIENKNDIKKWH